MQNISFDDGFREFTINNDVNRVIRFNPSDFSILERFNTAQKKIEEAYDGINEDVKINNDGSPGDELEETAELIKKVNTLINEQVDYIFDSKVSSVAFGNQSPISMVKGVPLFERFIKAAQIYIEKEVMTEQKASQKRISKYTSQVK